MFHLGRDHLHRGLGKRRLEEADGRGVASKRGPGEGVDDVEGQLVHWCSPGRRSLALWRRTAASESTTSWPTGRGPTLPRRVLRGPPEEPSLLSSLASAGFPP